MEEYKKNIALFSVLELLVPILKDDPELNAKVIHRCRITNVNKYVVLINVLEFIQTSRYNPSSLETSQF